MNIAALTLVEGNHTQGLAALYHQINSCGGISNGSAANITKLANALQERGVITPEQHSSIEHQMSEIMRAFTTGQVSRVNDLLKSLGREVRAVWDDLGDRLYGIPRETTPTS